MSSKVFSLIPALDDPDLTRLDKLVQAVGSHPLLSGYKVGFTLGLTHGLPRVVETIRRHSDKPIIYDHQKAATDIPATGKLFARTLKSAGVDTAILFPQAGPETLRHWVAALFEENMKVLVGGIMTHPAYLQSEGGYLSDEGTVDIYRLSHQLGVRGFVVPLTKPREAQRVVEQAQLGSDCEFYSPGFGAQGGDVTAFPFVRTHHLIVGRALLQASDPAAWLDATGLTLRGVP
jgi:orotidine-5'-phosphate decarboxylase